MSAPLVIAGVVLLGAALAWWVVGERDKSVASRAVSLIRLRRSGAFVEAHGETAFGVEGAAQPPRTAFGRLEWAVFIISSYVVLNVVLGTPVTGLGDQGDFQRIAYQLGIAPVATQPYSAGFVTISYRTGLDLAQVGVGQNILSSPALLHYYYGTDGYRSSEILLAKIALGAHAIFDGGTYFDIRWQGAVNAVVLLAGLAAVLAALRQLPGKARIVAVLLAGVAFTDPGYVLYMNSLFSEPAEIGFILLSLGLLGYAPSARRPMLVFFGFVVAGMLAATAKSADAFLCVPIALVGAVIAWRRLPKGPKRMAGVLLSGAIVIAGAYGYVASIPYNTQVYDYDTVFIGVLPHVQDKPAALKALGVSPELARYSGYEAFEKGSAFAAPFIYKDFFSHITLSKVVRYYVEHPLVLLSLLGSGASQSLQLRVTYLGDYPSNSSYLAGAQYANSTPWTVVHRDILPGQLWFIAAILLATCVIGVRVLRAQRRHGVRAGPPAELLIAIPIIAVTAYVQAMVSQATQELTKHQFPFNFLFDLCLIVVVATAVEYGPTLFSRLVNDNRWD